MRGWIIAHSVDLVATGERAFIEQLGETEPDRLTYSSLMSPQDCAAIDLGAYRDARSWYVIDGTDMSVVDGVSLGRAFEYSAIVTLIRHRRAALVLTRLLADSKNKTVCLRGVGDEWSTMAQALGAEPIVDGPEAVPYPGAAAYVTPPTRLRRLAARAAGILAPRDPELVLVGSPVWARPYQRHLLRGGAVQLVDPSRQVLFYAISQLCRSTTMWLADLNEDDALREAADEPVDLRGEEPIRVVSAGFQLFKSSLIRWAAAGRRVGGPGVVAISGQDVLPPERAFLLGVRAAGGRVITLEHGISGGYAEQVASVADALAVWGEPQAAYHRSAGPSGLRVSAVGWPRLESPPAIASPAEDAAWDLIHFSQPSDDLSAGDWPEAHIHALQMVEEYAREHPHRRVAIKLHPASQAYRFAPPPIRHAHLVKDESLALIGAARIVLVVASTTGIEAMSLGRPVLQVPPRGHAGSTEFLGESGAVRLVDSAKDLAAATEYLLGDSSAYLEASERGRAFAASFIKGFEHPGGAVRRLAELVAELGHS